MNSILAREIFPEEEFHLCVRMASFAYDGVTAFSNFKILAYSEENRLYKPVWLCVKSGEDIYVVIRGTVPGIDFITDVLGFEIKRCISGVDISFHAGFFFSASSIYDSIKGHLHNSKGKIIFTGHSLGAAIASNLCIFAKLDPELSDRYIRAYCIAPPPSSSYNTPEIQRCIMSIVNDGDPVPTLSLKNLRYVVVPFKKLFHAYAGTSLELASVYLKAFDLITPNGTTVNDIFKSAYCSTKKQGNEQLKNVFKSEKFNISKPNGSICFLTGNGSDIYRSIFADHEKLHRIGGSLNNHGIELYDNIIFQNC